MYVQLLLTQALSVGQGLSTGTAKCAKLSHMSRYPRDTPAGGVEPAPNPHLGAAPPATLSHSSASPASSTLPQPRSPQRKRKPSAALNALAIAVGQSQRNMGADPATEPETSASDLARTYALTHTPPTEQQAYDLAKLLRAGVPQPDALAYVLGPGLDPRSASAILFTWLRSPALRDALATLNGGAWPTLAPEARLDVALDKHYAEMAYFLYTHDFEQATGPELRKLDTARQALEAQRTGKLQANSPFMKFLTAILKPGADALRLGSGEGMPGDHRPAMTLGLADVEPVVDGQVVETSDEGA